MTAAPVLFGIDLGGTKIEGVVLAPDGTEQMRHRVPTPRGDYDATLDAIATVVAHLEQGTGARAERIGIGVPGSPRPGDGRLRGANSTWLNGRPLGADLARRLARPVRLANDANCLALSESRDGAAAGADSLFAVILGTGVGGGIVLNGRLVEGAHGIGGEWGHVPLPGMDRQAAPACFCGGRGCIETWLSGPGLVADYARHGGAADASRVEQIVARAEAGEAAAKRALERHARRLGRALAMVVNILDPEVIVLGGGVSRIPGLAGRLPALIRPHVFEEDPCRFAPRVVLSRWGDSSGVRGAARLWEQAAPSAEREGQAT